MKVGFINLLTLIFVIAKLAGVISWSWWLVFSPTIAMFGIVSIIFTLALLIAAIEGN